MLSKHSEWGKYSEVRRVATRLANCEQTDNLGTDCLPGAVSVTCLLAAVLPCSAMCCYVWAIVLTVSSEALNVHTINTPQRPMVMCAMRHDTDTICANRVARYLS